MRFLHKINPQQKHFEVMQFQVISMGIQDSSFNAISFLREIAKIAEQYDENLAQIIRNFFT